MVTKNKLFVSTMFCSLLLAAGLFSSCKEKVIEKKVVVKKSKPVKVVKPVKLEKHIHICWTKGFPTERLELAATSLANYYGAKIYRMGEEVIPARYFNPKSGKAFADSVIDFFSRKYNIKDGKILLLTSKQISTNRKLNGKIFNDYTIMGLSRVPYNSCVISTYTMSGKRHDARFVKTVLHEIGHTYGVNHCKKTKGCLMADLKGEGGAMDQNSDQMCVYCAKIVGLK